MSSTSGLPTTPNNSHLRSGLPTPSKLSAGRASLGNTTATSTDSPDTLFKKHSLAEAISRHDPAKYRSSASPAVSGLRRDDAESDNSSPLLVAGRVPRSSVLARKSTVGLRPQTPTERGAQPHASPLYSQHVRTASRTSSNRDSVSQPSPPSLLRASPGSTSVLARTRSPLPSTGTPSAHAALRAFSTPAKRYSDANAHVPSHGRTPSHSASTASSRAKLPDRRGRELEIGDQVRMEGSNLIGVLRHLGPVEFRPGFYAGLELIGDSVGQGKNDGSVQGVQYFACPAGNGVFCPASKVVAMNAQPPSEAVARPASSMSNRSSSRASDASERHSAITPARRRISSVAMATTPSRSSSRASARPPSVTPGSRSVSALGTSRPASRLTQMESHTTDSGLATPSSSIAAARASRASVGGVTATPVLAKKRQSLGGLPTPRATKGRQSMFAKPSTATDSSMPPPPSPTKGGRTDRAVSALSFRSNSRLGQQSPGASQDSAIDRNMILLEQMDLTPKRAASTVYRPQSRAESRAGLHAATADGDLTRDSIAEAVVPLSLYEDQVAEFDRLQLQLEQLEKQNQEMQRTQAARKARMSEARSAETVLEEERAKMRQEARERQREMEEERRLERDDELRRRKEIEDREREAKDKLHEVQNELSKLADEQDKARSEFESHKRSLQTKVDTSEALVQEMKKRIDEQSADKQRGQADEIETQLKVKDMEIKSLKESQQRLEAEYLGERKQLSNQIDELKGAGRETISLYEQRIDEIERERYEMLENMELLEGKAQEAIRAAEARYEDLQMAHQAKASGGALSGAAQIDNEALQEQVTHLQDKLGKYEDQIAEAALVLEKEKENSHSRRQKSQEVEASLKNEVKRLKVAVDRLQRSEKELKQVLEETRRALQDSQAALERERAELEVLRADAENLTSLGGEARGQANLWRTEKAQMEAEIQKLRGSKGIQNVEGENGASDVLQKQLQAKDEELRHVRARLEQARQVSRGSISVTDPSNDTCFESELSPKPTQDKRFSTASITSVGSNRQGPTPSESSANQMSGLSYLVRQLTDENNQANAKFKLMESTLRSELQEETTRARTLEITLDSLRQQSDSNGVQNGVAAQLADCETRLRQSEATIASLRKSVELAEQDKERVTSNLRKEVTELETLVESRIYREEELIAEVERLRKQIDKKNSPVRTNGRSSSEIRAMNVSTALPPVPAMPTQITAPTAPAASDEDELDDFCGLCSSKGHSLPDCPKLPVLKAPKTSAVSQTDDVNEPCDDCGEVGHKFEDCPYAAEMF